MGDPIGTLPTTSKYGYVFDGWYLDNNTFQNEVTTSYIPDASKTIYAKWIKSVNAMVFEDTDLYINVNKTKQINITNASSIGEEYTYTSSNTSIATVSNTGLVTAVGVGDTTITITGSTTNETKQVNVHVSDDNIELFDPTSPAIKNYLANINTWKNLDEDTFIQVMKNDFETYNCKWNTESKYVSWTSTWKQNGTVDCDRPIPYDTGAKSSINVYLYNSEENHDYSSDTPISYLNITDDGKIYNMIPGEIYHWVKTSDNTVSGNVKAMSKVRTLYISNARNIRELGGLPVDTDGDGTIDGYTKYGMLFRGERLYEASAHPYTGSGDNTNILELTNLGAVFELDLRGGGEGQNDVRLPSRQLQSISHYRPDTNANSIRAALRLAMNSVISGNPVISTVLMVQIELEQLLTYLKDYLVYLMKIGQKILNFLHSGE